MTFKTIKGCRRSREEQRYIWAALEIWNRLPERRREEMRELIGGVSGSPRESRATRSSAWAVPSPAVMDRASSSAISPVLPFILPVLPRILSASARHTAISCATVRMCS